MGLAVKLSARRQAVARIDSLSTAIALFLPELDGLAFERLCVAHLDADLRLLGMMVSDGGSSRSVPVCVRAMLRDALRLDTRGLLIAHNHPGGNPEPSSADRAVTRLLGGSARAVGVTLLDHLIFAQGQVVSFREIGLI